jgi:molybdopterin synthase catalytic subunit
MYVLGVVGDGAGALLTTLPDELDGAVATVESLQTAGGAGPTRPAAATAYGLAPDGAWVGAGDGASLDDLLDHLAPDHSYALLDGFPDATVPTVVVGTAAAEDEDGDVEPIDPAGDVVGRYDRPEAVDIPALLDALHRRDPHITLQTLVDRVETSPHADRAGAVATFTGRVRARDDPDDTETAYLEFERYDEVAADRMAAIRADLEAREGVFEVRMHHRTGVVPAGDDVVFVVALAGHRREAFRATEDGIDRLKSEVPLFKKEVTADETFWVHERA